MALSPLYTVSEITFAVKRNLETAFSSIKVKGEVTNLRRQASGHIYFTLKDAEAQISAVLFQGNASRLTRLPKEGDQIVVEGAISLYAPRGTYQIIVQTVTFDGLGALLLKFQELKNELKNLGWFDPEHKKPLPKFPKTIGVITSPSGAVIRDIIHVLSRRMRNFHLIVYPVKVQGEGAKEEIAKAVQELNRYPNLVDVIILARGGGSLEDLWPFNERIVAEAIFHSKIPLISAVGHETDFSLSDFVADLRAPTPSAAAEIISQEAAQLLKNLANWHKTLSTYLLQILSHRRAKIERFLHHPKLRDPYTILAPYEQAVDDAAERLTLLTPLKEIEKKRDRLLRLKEHLLSIHPEEVLKKGYCLCFQQNDSSLILESSKLSPGAPISLRFHDGSVEALTTAIKPKRVTKAHGKALLL